MDRSGVGTDDTTSLRISRRELVISTAMGVGLTVLAETVVSLRGAAAS